MIYKFDDDLHEIVITYEIVINTLGKIVTNICIKLKRYGVLVIRLAPLPRLNKDISNTDLC